MSIFEENYLTLADTLFDALGDPHRYSTSHTLLFKQLKEDIENGECLFHRKEALAYQDIHEENIRLAVDADIMGQYRANDDIDPNENEDGMLLDEPFAHQESNFPRVALEYPHLSLEPRGERTALYEALEKYFIHREHAVVPPPLETQVLGKMMNLLTEIRITAFTQYRAEFIDAEQPGDSAYNLAQTAKAHKYADSYVLGALNAVNISQEGHSETVKDLLCRSLGKQLVNQKLASVRPSDGSDYLFYGKMISAHELQRQA